MHSTFRKGGGNEPAPQSFGADVHLCAGYRGLLCAALEKYTRRAYSILSSGVLLAFLRRDRAGVADVSVPLEMSCQLSVVGSQSDSVPRLPTTDNRQLGGGRV